MKSILFFAVLGAFVIAARCDDDSEAKGVAGFPTCSLNGLDWQDKIVKVAGTFNEYANSTSAYVVEQVGRFMKMTGDIIVVTKDGTTQMLDTIYIDRYGRVKSETGEEIKGVQGIIGGEKNRLEDLSNTAFKMITEAFVKGEAFLSSLPNDIWIFGKTSFDLGATITAHTARMITQVTDDVWTKMVPLSDATKSDVEKLVFSGINLAIVPAKIMIQGAGTGFKALRDLTGLAVGVPLAVGSSMARTGADIVTTGAGMFGRMADGVFGYGQKLAGLNKQKQ